MPVQLALHNLSQQPIEVLLVLVRYEDYFFFLGEGVLVGSDERKGGDEEGKCGSNEHEEYKLLFVESEVGDLHESKGTRGLKRPMVFSMRSLIALISAFSRLLFRN